MDDVQEEAVLALAARAGFKADQQQVTEALAVYRERRRLQPDFVKGIFVPFTKGEQGNLVAHGTEGQPLLQMGPNIAFNKLVAALAAAKFENEVLRQSLIPQLGADTLGRTMAEFIPYAWMGTLLMSLKAYSDADTNWTAHPLAQAIWQVVNEEIRATRQGRQSTPTRNPMGQQQKG